MSTYKITIEFPEEPPVTHMVEAISMRAAFDLVCPKESHDVVMKSASIEISTPREALTWATNLELDARNALNTAVFQDNNDVYFAAVSAYKMAHLRWLVATEDMRQCHKAGKFLIPVDGSTKKKPRAKKAIELTRVLPKEEPMEEIKLDTGKTRLDPVPTKEGAIRALEKDMAVIKKATW